MSKKISRKNGHRLHRAARSAPASPWPDRVTFKATGGGELTMRAVDDGIMFCLRRKSGLLRQVVYAHVADNEISRSMMAVVKRVVRANGGSITKRGNLTEIKPGKRSAARAEAN